MVMTQQKYAVSAKNLTSQRNELIQPKNTLCEQKLPELSKCPLSPPFPRRGEEERREGKGRANQVTRVIP